MFNPEETQYEVLRRRGICRRDFLKFCSMAAVALGLGPMGHLEIAHAMETNPICPFSGSTAFRAPAARNPLSVRAHPLASDIILSMIALDYQDTIMAAAGDQAMECFEEAISTYKGRYILAVEGNPPLGEEGMYCIDGGRPFMDKLQRGAAGAKAIVAWGTCASWGCVQAARPNPTQATPIHKVIHDKPIIKVPGCPAIPDVMSNIVAYILTYDQIPKLDSQGRPEVFYGKRVHDQCVRRAHFDAGQFVESWDDAAASLGYCLYKMGCKGPTTYNACPVTRWNNGFPIPSSPATGCIGCAEQNFWDHGSFYSRITNIPQFGTNTTAETVGVAAVAGIGAGVVTHAAISTAVHLKHRYGKDGDCSKETKTAQAEKTASNDSTPSERN